MSGGDTQAPIEPNGGATPGTASASPPRKRRRRIAVTTALVIVIVWTAAAMLTLWQAKEHAEAGERILSALEDRLVSVESSDDITASLREAIARLDAARNRVRSPVVIPARFVPFIGRQIRSFDALTTAARSVADIGLDLTAEITRGADQDEASGAQRVAVTRRLASTTQEAETELGAIDLGPRTWLLPQLADKQRAIATDLEAVRSILRKTATVSAGFAEVLEGPRRYLLLVSNNAEMRAGSGMFLTAGTLEFSDGDWVLGPLEWTRDLTLGNDAVDVTGDLDQRWGWLNPGKDWRNVNVTPRFDASAELAARMWEAAGRDRVDGVLSLDVLAFKAVLEATGPVDAQGRTVAADDVVQEILHDQYVEFPSIDVRPVREDLQEHIARAALDRLADGNWDPVALARHLSGAARGRHVLAWARDADEQRLWEEAGIDGTLDEQSLMVSVLNRNGTKLDQFLEVDASLEITRGGDIDELELRIELENTVPEGEPEYIVGPHPDSPVGEGVYFGIVTVNLPGATTFATIDGHEHLAVAGPDGPTTLVGAEVTIPRGDRTELVVRFQMPTDGRAVRIEPSARIPAIRWSAVAQTWTDDEAREVRW